MSEVTKIKKDIVFFIYNSIIKKSQCCKEKVKIKWGRSELLYNRKKKLILGSFSGYLTYIYG